MTRDTRNSYITSPDYMQTAESFNEIVSWCGLPDKVAYTWLELMGAWINGGVSDALLLDYMAWLHPEIFEATWCLINVYSGGAI